MIFKNTKFENSEISVFINITCISANFTFVYNVVQPDDGPYRTVFKLRVQIVRRVWRYVSAVYNTVNLVSGGTSLYF